MNFNSFTIPSEPILNDFDVGFSKSIVIFGDSNLSGLCMNDSSVVSSSKCRLSFLKKFLVSESEAHQEVKKVFICFSALDSKNKAYTNFFTLRSVIYNARRIFPEASIYVILPKVQQDLTNVQELSHLIFSKKPGGCIPAYMPSICTFGHVWNNEVLNKFSVFLKSFL